MLKIGNNVMLSLGNDKMLKIGNDVMYHLCYKYHVSVEVYYVLGEYN